MKNPKHQNTNNKQYPKSNDQNRIKLGAGFGRIQIAGRNLKLVSNLNIEIYLDFGI
jgi:hypothetical protein